MDFGRKGITCSINLTGITAMVASLRRKAAAELLPHLPDLHRRSPPSLACRLEHRRSGNMDGDGDEDKAVAKEVGDGVEVAAPPTPASRSRRSLHLAARQLEEEADGGGSGIWCRRAPSQLAGARSSSHATCYGAQSTSRPPSSVLRRRFSLVAGGNELELKRAGGGRAREPPAPTSSPPTRGQPAGNRRRRKRRGNEGERRIGKKSNEADVKRRTETPLQVMNVWMMSFMQLVMMIYRMVLTRGYLSWFACERVDMLSAEPF